MLQARLPNSLATQRAPAVRVTPARQCGCAALDPKRTAVVLIEIQNEFATPGGKLHEAVKPVMEATRMMDNTLQTVEAARKAGALIVHVPIVFSDAYDELPEKPYGILGNVKAAGAFKKSEWGGAIVDPLTPKPGEIVVEGKRGLCGFASTNLDFVLRQRGIENMALGGFLTNCCVESTMRSAYERGFNVFTLTDCCAATSMDEQEAATKFTFPMFSKPVTHKQFISELGAK